jgi:hypothetical protein
MIYLKEPLTDNIVKFENEDQIGAGFSGCEVLTQDEANDYELSQAKLDKITQVLVNRNNWMYQTVTYATRPYTATKIAGDNLTQAARSPRNIAIGLVNWMTDTWMTIELLISEMEDIINLIEDQRSYSYFHEATLVGEINAIEIIPEVTYDQAMQTLNNIEVTSGVTYDQAMEALNNIDITF